MAKKRTIRPRGEIAGLATQLDAFITERPDLSIDQAITASGIKGINVKAYRQLKYRQRKKGQDIPLDVIPERPTSSGMSTYKARKITANAQNQVAIDLLKMALKILEAK